MKKLLALLLVFLMLISTFTGCEDDNTSSESSSSKEQISSEEQVPSEKPEEPSSSETPIVESEPEDTADVPSEEPEEPSYEYEPDEEEIIPSEPLTPEEERLANMLAGKDAELNKDALYNEGNLARLAKAIKKGKSGKLVKVVFYGNSVNTAKNSDIAMADTPYSQLFKYWWEENVGANINVTLAGTENLTSINACMRVEHDVLQWEPDIVFLDFAVQDGISSLAKTNSQGYDNLIRRILQSKTSPAVISLILTGAEQTTYTMNPKNANIFASASKQHKEIAEYYDIPVIDFETALWDNMIEVVQVTTYKEEPLITWETISTNNMTMNNDGHMVLHGTIAYFMEKVMAKLDKISTKDPAYPTEGFYGTNKYMTGSFVTVGDIIEGDAKGYAFDLDEAGLKKYDYDYTSANPGNTLHPFIKTYRHYIAESDAEEDTSVEENPYYLNLTMPKVTNNETYFMVYTTSAVSTKYVSNKNILDYAPVAIVCYDESGNVLSTMRAPSGNFVESTNLGKTSAIKINPGTTRIEIKTYTKSGTIRLLGVGSFDANS